MVAASCALLTASLARTAPSQVESLWSLYQLAGGADWRYNENWSPDGDPCAFDRRWAGVGCVDPCLWHDGPTCAFGMVSSLALDFNGLVGSLSNWTNVSALTNLTLLDVSGNELSGTLPTELGHVDMLRNLVAPLNRFVGHLPTQLGAINSRAGVAELEELNLRASNLSGTLPTQLGRHSRLQSLDVRANGLSGTLPWQLASDGASLIALHAHDNGRLSGTLPTQLGALSALRYLEVSRNELSGTLPPSLGSPPLLHALHVESNALSGSLPDEFVELPVLRTLRLANNRLVGQLPPNIGKLRTVRGCLTRPADAPLARARAL
jgi:hypothetical protein